jgi:NADPH2 dehydrogenase
MAHLFESFSVEGVTLRNHIMMSPMLQRSATADGLPTQWHLLHYGARAVGGVGLIMCEGTSVERRGRITERDLGLWDDRQVAPLAQVVAACHEHGAAIGVQLAHHGRKAWADNRGYGPEPTVAPSALAFGEGWSTPHALTTEEIEGVVTAFADAAERARDAGFDVVEVHAAHGYLINEFLSPLTNRRNDHYGGTLENRLRFLLRVIDATRKVWEDRPLFTRVSATDYEPGGINLEDMVAIARHLRAAGVSMLDVSSGGITPKPPPTWPGYQVPFAERIRREVGIPTVAVGLITRPEQAEEVIAKGCADLVALGRELLRDPYWPLRAAGELGAEFPWPRQYQRAKPEALKTN